MRTRTCSGCGEAASNPWEYCDECTGALLDVSRPPGHRRNPDDVLQAQLRKIRDYAEREKS